MAFANAVATAKDMKVVKRNKLERQQVVANALQNLLDDSALTQEHTDRLKGPLLRRVTLTSSVYWRNFAKALEDAGAGRKEPSLLNEHINVSNSYTKPYGSKESTGKAVVAAVLKAHSSGSATLSSKTEALQGKVMAAVTPGVTQDIVPNTASSSHATNTFTATTTTTTTTIADTTAAETAAARTTASLSSLSNDVAVINRNSAQQSLVFNSVSPSSENGTELQSPKHTTLNTTSGVVTTPDHATTIPTSTGTRSHIYTPATCTAPASSLQAIITKLDALLPPTEELQLLLNPLQPRTRMATEDTDTTASAAQAAEIFINMFTNARNELFAAAVRLKEIEEALHKECTNSTHNSNQNSCSYSQDPYFLSMVEKEVSKRVEAAEGKRAVPTGRQTAPIAQSGERTKRDTELEEEVARLQRELQEAKSKIADSEGKQKK